LAGFFLDVPPLVDLLGLVASAEITVDATPVAARQIRRAPVPDMRVEDEH
jgi:hypothetical protein